VRGARCAAALAVAVATAVMTSVADPRLSPIEAGAARRTRQVV